MLEYIQYESIIWFISDRLKFFKLSSYFIWKGISFHTFMNWCWKLILMVQPLDMEGSIKRASCIIAVITWIIIKLLILQGCLSRQGICTCKLQLWVFICLEALRYLYLCIRLENQDKIWKISFPLFYFEAWVTFLHAGCKVEDHHTHRCNIELLHRNQNSIVPMLLYYTCIVKFYESLVL